MRLPSNLPMYVLHVPAFNPQSTLPLWREFPLRSVFWMRLDWGEHTPDACESVAFHECVMKQTSWTCRGCRAVNRRTQSTCAGCKLPRAEGKSRSGAVNHRFRSAGPRSAAAAATRAKLQGKLRSEYRAELDKQDELVEQREKLRTASTRGYKN
jgi:hypothetical protein